MHMGANHCTQSAFLTFARARCVDPANNAERALSTAVHGERVGDIAHVCVEMPFANVPFLNRQHLRDHFWPHNSLQSISA
jgi:hypothetical protein